MLAARAGVLRLRLFVRVPFCSPQNSYDSWQIHGLSSQKCGMIGFDLSPFEVYRSASDFRCLKLQVAAAVATPPRERECLGGNARRKPISTMIDQFFVFIFVVDTG